MKFPIRIPKGWRRLRLGEIVPEGYKYYDKDFKSILNGHYFHYGKRNNDINNLRIILKNK